MIQRMHQRNIEKMMNDRSKLLREMLLSTDRKITKQEAETITGVKGDLYAQKLLDLPGIKYSNSDGTYLMTGDENTTGFSTKHAARIRHENEYCMLNTYAKFINNEDKINVNEILQRRALEAIIY